MGYDLSGFVGVPRNRTLIDHGGGLRGNQRGSVDSNQPIESLVGLGVVVGLVIADLHLGPTTPIELAQLPSRQLVGFQIGVGLDPVAKLGFSQRRQMFAIDGDRAFGPTVGRTETLTLRPFRFHGSMETSSEAWRRDAA